MPGLAKLYPNRENLQRLSDTLTYLGIMGDNSENLLKPLDIKYRSDVRGVSEEALIVPHDAERRQHSLMADCHPAGQSTMIYPAYVSVAFQ